MSVFIEDYCKENNNDLARRLQALLDEGALEGSDELNVDTRGLCTTARIYIPHTISCLDVDLIQDTLDDCYWRFQPCLGRSGIYLSILTIDRLL